MGTVVMMFVRVVCIGSATRTFAFTSRDVEVEEGSTARGIVTSLTETSRERWLLTVNGKRLPDDYTIQDGDTIRIVPIVGAG